MCVFIESYPFYFSRSIDLSRARVLWTAGLAAPVAAASRGRAGTKPFVATFTDVNYVPANCIRFFSFSLSPSLAFSLCYSRGACSSVDLARSFPRALDSVLRASFTLGVIYGREGDAGRDKVPSEPG